MKEEGVCGEKPGSFCQGPGGGAPPSLPRCLEPLLWAPAETSWRVSSRAHSALACTICMDFEKRASRRGESDEISALGPKVTFRDLLRTVQRRSDTVLKVILAFLQNKRLACTRAPIWQSWAPLGPPLAPLAKVTRLEKHGIYSVCEGS